MVMKAERILVPLDGSQLAEMALPTAVELLSNAPGATIILLRAAETRSLPGVDPVDAQASAVREAESYLATVADGLCEQGITRVVRSVWYSSAAKAIVEAARVRGVDLIVMSTHGPSGVRRALRGSVAETVLRGTRTPILLVSAGGSVDMGSHRATTTRKSRRRMRPTMSSAGPFGPSRSR